ncbi:MAG: hypothetical protein MUC30_05245 [Bacteroidales bacterium]|jgi:hypothetical protein|nr:hypothetical protein [Bacteroidales bacterium]
MFLKLLVISALLIAFALVAMAVSILLRRGGRFPDTHISHNREMRKRGITCAQHNDIGCQPAQNAAGCAGCSRVED